jgi:hypothetical protein
MVVQDIAERHAKGQPILVGTTSVEKSEYLSKLLAKAGIKHEVLNAKNNAREAVIVAQAGQFGAVTVATNMAGRGTDIMLGGNAEFLAVQQMHKLGLDPVDQAEQYEEAWDEIFSKVKQDVAKEAERVLGGQANVWTEWIPDVRRYDMMVWPRMLAMSEVLWSTAPKDFTAFSKRVNASYPLLEQMGVDYYLEEPVTETSFFFNKAPTVFSSSQFTRPVYFQVDPKAPAEQWQLLGQYELPANKAFYVAYKRNNGTLGDIAELYRSDKIAQVPAGSVVPGLKVSFWEGTYKSCSDFEDLSPKGSGVANAVGLFARPRANNYALRFTGKIRFPGRKFKLYLTSDDGSVLRLNGIKVINHDGPHGDTTKSVGIEVTDGVYDFDLRYFEAGGGSALRLEVEGSGLKRQPVPQSWFSR